MTVLRSGSASDVGRVRTVNEDLALESLTLFAVADGMGGHVGGEIAARIAIDTLQSEFGRAPSADGLVGAVHQANAAVWERGRTEPDLRGMGTTLIAAALVSIGDGDRLVLTNVGDSRAYRFHGHLLSQLTRDHSVAEELVARGELSEEEAAVHPHRHILTRALGVAPEVAVDVWQLVPEEGDRYLLCSDGVSNEVPADEITDVLAATRDPRAAAETLVRLANEAGGNDNATVVVLDVVVGEDAPSMGTGAGTAGASAVPGAVAAAAAAAGTSASPGATTAVADPRGPAPTPAPTSTPAPTPAPTSAPAPAPAPAPEVSVSGAGPATVNGTGAAVVARSAPPVRPGRPSPPGRARHPGVRVPRRITFRVVLFLLLLGGLAYGGYSVIRWYVNNSYFVGLNHHSVVIYQGRRGGFVGIEPKIVKRYDLTTSQVPQFDLSALRGGVEEPSFSAAQNYVTGLQQEPCTLQGAPASCSTTTTSPLGSPTSPSTSLGSGVDPPARSAPGPGLSALRAA